MPTALHRKVLMEARRPVKRQSSTLGVLLDQGRLVGLAKAARSSNRLIDANRATSRR